MHGVSGFPAMSWNAVKEAGPKEGDSHGLPAHVDVLYSGVAEKLIQTFFLTDAALFPAAVRGTELSALGVNPDITRLDALGSLHSLFQIVGDNGRGESVHDAVGLLEHVLVVGPLHHRHHRPEDLLVTDAHIGGDGAKYRRFNEVPVGQGRISGPTPAG